MSNSDPGDPFFTLWATCRGYLDGTVQATTALDALELAEQDSFFGAGVDETSVTIRVLRAACVRLIGEYGAPVTQRAVAGRILGLVGDPRPGVGALALEWCRIAAGTYQIGADPAASAPWAGALVSIPYDYWIGRYPVTVAQYKPFVDDGGYTERHYACWTKAGLVWKGPRPYNLEPWSVRQQPLHWDDPHWTLPNHPIVGVCWYEAYAYARWLEKIRRAEGFAAPEGVPAGHIVRLPTEAEWEIAARWPKNQPITAVEAEHANTEATRIRRTSAVGIFPAAPCGASDLSGNVQEWCQSKWATRYQYPEKNLPEGRSARVIRGGSWHHVRPYARAASRFGSNPEARTAENGVRLVLAVPLAALR